MMADAVVNVMSQPRTFGQGGVTHGMNGRLLQLVVGDLQLFVRLVQFLQMKPADPIAFLKKRNPSHAQVEAERAYP